MGVGVYGGEKAYPCMVEVREEEGGCEVGGIRSRMIAEMEDEADMAKSRRKESDRSEEARESNEEIVKAIATVMKGIQVAVSWRKSFFHPIQGGTKRNLAMQGRTRIGWLFMMKSFSSSIQTRDLPAHQ